MRAVTVQILYVSHDLIKAINKWSVRDAKIRVG